MAKGLTLGLAVGLLLFVGLLGYQRAFSSCPCGFKRDAFTGGCVVDLNAPPCTSGGGPSANPPGGSPGGRDTYVTTPDPFPANNPCPYVVNACRLAPDWKSAEFTVAVSTLYTPGTTAGPRQVMLAISQRDKDNRSCANIRGDLDVAVPSTTQIPFDAAALAGRFPMATTSASGTSRGLLASFGEGCEPVLTRMKVGFAPNMDCGCELTIPRP